MREADCSRAIRLAAAAISSGRGDGHDDLARMHAPRTLQCKVTSARWLGRPGFAVWNLDGGLDSPWILVAAQP